MPSFRLLILVATCSIIMMPADAARGQTSKTRQAKPKAPAIQWRRDYAAALKEAEQRKRPLFLFFVTESSFHSIRCEIRTLANPKVAGLLNQRYIPFKAVHAKNKELLEAFEVKLFPTLVVASPDGTILRKLVGFQEVDELLAILQP